MARLSKAGLPGGLIQDSWWFEAADLKRGPIAAPKTMNLKLITALLIAIVTADIFFWDGGFGLALIVFVQLITAFALFLFGKEISNKQAALYTSASALSALPWFIQPQFFAFLFLFLGYLAIIGHGLFGRVTWFAPRFLLLWVPLVFRSGFFAITDTAKASSELKSHKAILRDLALPLSALVVFTILFAVANPVIENSLSKIITLEIPEEFVVRCLFWIIILGLALPILNLPRVKDWVAPKSLRPLPVPSLRTRPVLWTLAICNIIFLLQMGLDGSVLVLGELPEGVSYATYAHRGAYPLAVTAVLALAFMLLCHKRARENKAIRVLLFLWIAQNTALLGSALYRMWIYVDAFGLTYLRLNGTVGMIWVLVALGLMTVLLLHRREAKWLLARLALVACTTIYGMSTVNIAQFIAATNLQMSLSKDDPNWLDRYYLCGLMPYGVPALNAHIEKTGVDPLDGLNWWSSVHVKDWRDWSYREGEIELAMTRYYRLKGEL